MKPKLPPGCAWTGIKGQYRRHDGKLITLFSGDQSAAQDAWTEFTRFTGISKERWEQIERDCDAMDNIRVHSHDVELFTGSDEEGDIWWSAGLPAGKITSDWWADPAEALLHVFELDEEE